MTSELGVHEALVLGEWMPMPKNVSELKAALEAAELWDGEEPFFTRVATLRRAGLFRVRGGQS